MNVHTQVAYWKTQTQTGWVNFWALISINMDVVSVKSPTGFMESCYEAQSVGHRHVGSPASVASWLI